MHFLSGQFDMLVSIWIKNLKRLWSCRKKCDQRITRSSSQLLHLQEASDQRVLQKYKAQGSAALAHAGRQPNQQF